jgi:hypothetical protein
VRIPKCLRDGRHANSRHSFLSYTAFHQDQLVGNRFLLLSQNMPFRRFKYITQDRETSRTFMNVFSEYVLFMSLLWNARSDALQLFALLSVTCWTFVTDTRAEVRYVGWYVRWWQNKLRTKKIWICVCFVKYVVHLFIQTPQILIYEIWTSATLRKVPAWISYDVIQSAHVIWKMSFLTSCLF